MGGIKRVYQGGRWRWYWNPLGGRMAKAKSELLMLSKSVLMVQKLMSMHLIVDIDRSKVRHLR